MPQNHPFVYTVYLFLIYSQNYANNHHISVTPVIEMPKPLVFTAHFPFLLAHDHLYFPLL